MGLAYLCEKWEKIGSLFECVHTGKTRRNWLVAAVASLPHPTLIPDRHRKLFPLSLSLFFCIRHLNNPEDRRVEAKELPHEENGWSFLSRPFDHVIRPFRIGRSVTWFIIDVGHVFLNSPLDCTRAHRRFELLQGRLLRGLVSSSARPSTYTDFFCASGLATTVISAIESPTLSLGRISNCRASIWQCVSSFYCFPIIS